MKIFKIKIKPASKKDKKKLKAFQKELNRYGFGKAGSVFQLWTPLDTYSEKHEIHGIILPSKLHEKVAKAITKARKKIEG